jgi:hypothetical protein
MLPVHCSFSSFLVDIKSVEELIVLNISYIANDVGGSTYTSDLLRADAVSF